MIARLRAISNEITGYISMKGGRGCLYLKMCFNSIANKKEKDEFKSVSGEECLITDLL